MVLFRGKCCSPTNNKFMSCIDKTKEADMGVRARTATFCIFWKEATGWEYRPNGPFVEIKQGKTKIAEIAVGQIQIIEHAKEEFKK